MEKVKVSRELAEALDSVMNQYPGHEKLLRLHVETKTGAKVEWGGDWNPINKLSAVELSKILIFGYEIEKTPEELLFDHYKYHKRSARKSDYSRGFISGVELALARLGLKVKGINDNDH